MKKIYAFPALALPVLLGLAWRFPDAPRSGRNRTQPTAIRGVSPAPAPVSLTLSTPPKVDAPAQQPSVPEDIDRLQAWILSLSDSELGNLIGTNELDRHVERVVVGMERRQADPSLPSPEVDIFLMMLNKRMEAAQL